MSHESGSLLSASRRKTTLSSARAFLMICEADLSASFKRFAYRFIGPVLLRRLDSPRSAQIAISATDWPRLILLLLVEQSNIHGGTTISHKHLVLLCNSNRSNSSKNLRQCYNSHIQGYGPRLDTMPLPSHSP